MPSQPRVNSVIGASVGSAWIVYVIVASFGYITYGDKVMSDVLKTYPGVGGSPISKCKHYRTAMEVVMMIMFPFLVRVASRPGGWEGEIVGTYPLVSLC